MNLEKVFKSRSNGKLISNKEITRDSIIDFVYNENIDYIEVGYFLNLLDEDTLEVILKDVSNKRKRLNKNV